MGTSVRAKGRTIPMDPNTGEITAEVASEGTLARKKLSRDQACQGQDFTRPWQLETGWLEYYCTSMEMVWLAATRA
jgi:hypothetical protein